MRRFRNLLAPCLVLLVLAAACGDSDDATTDAADSAATETTAVAEEPTTTETTAAEGAEEEPPAEEPAGEEGAFPVTVPDGVGGEVVLEDAPERIVSLSATATEMLFAIGAGDQVVAVDDTSNFPEEAPVTDLSGFEPNLEAIASYEPDLVVISYDPGDLASGLAEIGVPTLNYGAATTLDDSFAQIEQLGAATGNLSGAAEVVAEMQRAFEDIGAAAREVTEAGDGPVTVYHELDDTFYSATSSTFIGQVYDLLGLENIADEADAEGFGYPQLSPEHIIEADPDVIVFTDDIGYTAEDIAARPGWDAITAVEEGNVIQVDGDLASRWGPRVIEFAQQVTERIAAMEPAGA